MFSVHGDSKVQIIDADAEAINMESTATTPDDLQDGTSKHRGLSFKNSGKYYLLKVKSTYKCLEEGFARWEGRCKTYSRDCYSIVSEVSFPLT